MVSFILDPRIKQAQERRQTHLAQMLKGYEPPPNAFGYTKFGHIETLANALFARQAGQEATKREEAQQLAQGEIYSALAKARQPTTAATLDVEGARFRRVPFQRSAIHMLPETLKTAGTTRQAMAADVASIHKASEVAYNKRQEAEIDRRLESITAAIAITGEGQERARLQSQRSQLLAIKDAAKTAVRQETQEIALDAIVDVWDKTENRNRKTTKREIQKNPENFGPSKKRSTSEIQVEMLMDIGVKKDIAKGIVAGRYVVKTNPVTKQPIIIDVSTGNRVHFEDAHPSPSGDGGGQRPPATGSAVSPITKTDIEIRSPGLYSIVRDSGAFDITGAVATGREFLEKTLGQFPRLEGSFMPKEIAEARQTILTAQNELVRALSINVKYPVAEQRRIREEINIAPAIWSNRTLLLARMRSVDGSLRARLVDEKKAAGNESLPPETRKVSAQRAKDIANFLQILDVPARDGDLPKPQTQAEFDALSPGALYISTKNGKKYRKPL
jgi:hypothetical protein